MQTLTNKGSLLAKLLINVSFKMMRKHLVIIARSESIDLCMKLKNLENAWHRTSSYSILNFPFACYSVQPFLNSGSLSSQEDQKYLVSFKASVLYPEPLDNLHNSQNEAELACEKHISKLMKYLFGRIDEYIEK